MTEESSFKLVVRKSPYSMSESLQRIEKGIESRGMAIFALIDHSGEAQKIGLNLDEEKVVIFGDPKVGTFLMQENPLIGIELPLRILVRRNLEGVVEIAYIEPLALEKSYEIKKNIEILKKMSKALFQLIDEATR